MTRCCHCGAICDAPLECCPACGALATLLPFEVAPPAAADLSQDAGDIEGGGDQPIPTGSEAWDEALGGGLVLGSSVVLYGDPGSRKSTWAGAIADHIACHRRGRALFLSAEMPSWRVRDAVLRLRTPKALSIVGSERDAGSLERSLAEVARMRPRVVVYDSIQSFDGPGSFAGSELAVSQTVRLARGYAARMHHIAILISQVNKAGLPAGPYRTIHDCDVVARVELGRVVVKKNRDAPAREAVLP